MSYHARFKQYQSIPKIEELIFNLIDKIDSTHDLGILEDSIAEIIDEKYDELCSLEEEDDDT